MLIGYTEQNHNTWKQFLLHGNDTLRYRRIIDQAGLQRAIRHLTGLSPQRHINQYYRGKQILGCVQLTHYWNAVSATRRPWVVTTSSGLPFGFPEHDSRFRPALESLAGPSCRRIIYTSGFALEKINRRVSTFNCARDILDKLEFLPPPQEVLMEPGQKSYHDEQLNIAMAAKYLSAKGGCELINAFARFIKNGASARLYIAGSRDSINMHASPRYAKRTQLAIDSCPDIHILGVLPQTGVLDLFRKSHFSFLPSYRETYGYVVLESQACACPVVTTTVGAFPEINNDQLGWQVKLPDALLNFDRIAPDTAFEASTQFEETLYFSLQKIENARSELQEKAKNAFHHIREQHNVAAHRATLVRIYTEALFGTT